MDAVGCQPQLSTHSQQLPPQLVTFLALVTQSSCHDRAAGRAFSLSYPHNYSMARESIQVPDYPGAARRMTDYHHQRQYPQKDGPLSYHGLGQDVS